jgi:hypothetical protein
MFGEGAAPPVGEIEAREAEEEQGVVSACPLLKKCAHSIPEIVFPLFSFH